MSPKENEFWGEWHRLSRKLNGDDLQIVESVLFSMLDPWDREAMTQRFEVLRKKRRMFVYEEFLHPVLVIGGGLDFKAQSTKMIRVI